MVGVFITHTCSCVGFDDVVLEHFQCQKDVILKQCSQWLKDSPTPQLKKKLQRAVAELQEEFDKI